MHAPTSSMGVGGLTSNPHFMRDFIYWIFLFFGMGKITINTRKVGGRERRKLLRKYRQDR